MGQLKTFNEFRVTFDDKGEINSKAPTDRITVRIDDETAELNNFYSKSTKMIYEEVNEQPEPVNESVTNDEQPELVKRGRPSTK